MNELMPWSYSGLLDDVSERYRITPEVDDTFFQRSIIRSILFSGPILLNDGYIFHHSIGLSQVLDEDSLLRVMTRNGFINVLSRGFNEGPNGFSRVPERLATRGVTTSQELTAKPEWEKAIRPSLEAWAASMFRQNRMRPWPNRKTEVGFRRLFERVFSKQSQDLGLNGVREGLLSSIQEKVQGNRSEQWMTAPRSAVEDSLKELFQVGLVSKSEIVQVMNLANQAYHYNFALCLSVDSRDSVVADTTIGPAFEDILQFDQSFEAEIEDMPTISIPRGFPLDRPALFDKLLDESTELYGFKRNLLATIDRMIVGGGNFTSQQRKREISEATEAYRRKLAEHFSREVSVSDLAPGRLAVAKGIVTMGYALSAGTIAVATEVASTAAKLAGKKNPIDAFMGRRSKAWSKHALEVGLDPKAGELRKDFVFRVNDVRPRFTSLAFNSVAIHKHAEIVPKFSE